MTHWEITRMVCYSLAAPSLLYLALFMLRNRSWAAGVFYLSVSLLFLWYLFDLTMVAAGVNEREMRWLATPLTVAAAVSAVWMALESARACVVIKQTRKGAAWMAQAKQSGK